MEKNKIVDINGKNLTIKEVKGKRVVTFKDIDLLHERLEGTANKRFLDNQKHFIKDEDYFEVTGDSLKKIKQLPNFGIRANVNKLILVTEGGYLLLVKSLNDELAWKVQRELVNNYFRVKQLRQPKSAIEVLELHYEAIKEVKTDVVELQAEIKDFKLDIPLFNVECKELQDIVKRKGVAVLGGKASEAYKDNSLRSKVYADIQRQIKREFGLSTYMSIKRRDLAVAKEIIHTYKVPVVLEREIENLNRYKQLAVVEV